MMQNFHRKNFKKFARNLCQDVNSVMPKTAIPYQIREKEGSHGFNR